MLRCLSLVLVLSLWGCSGKSDSDDSAPVGRGTAACQEWQTSVCDWGSRCGASAEQVTTCRRQAPGITCKSDEQASNCVAQLTSNACTAPPASCELKDLADPAPAMTACNQFVNAVCTAAERCEESTKAECLANPAISVLCTNAIGHTLAFEQCISDLGTLVCSAPEAATSCRAVIITG